MFPLVSIIIPIYNVAPYIERCLESVISQSYENLEIILVDDCGSDDSMDIVRDFCSSHTGNFVLLRHERNRGLSAARNTGVEHAKGDYLFFLDSDDALYSKESMALLKQYVDCYGYADFVLGGCYVIGGIPIPNKTKKYCESSDILNSYLERKWNVIACAKFIKRSFFISNSMWFKEGVLHEDVSFSFCLAFNAKSMITMDEYVYTYYMHDESISHRKRYKNYKDYLSIMVENHVLIKSLKNMNHALVSNFFIQGLFGFICSAINNPNISETDKRLLLIQYKVAIKNMKLSFPLSKKVCVEYMLLHVNNILFRFIISKLGIGKDA